MDGATGAALVLPVTIPEHPELTLTINAANKTRGQRFIACLSHKIFPGERFYRGVQPQQPAGSGCNSQPRLSRPGAQYRRDHKGLNVELTTAPRARKGAVRFPPERDVSIGPTWRVS